MHHSLYYTQQHWRAWTGPFQRASVPDVSYCNPVTLFPIVWLKSSPLVCPLHVAYKSGIQTFLENIKRFECILIHAVCWTQAPAIYIQAGSSDSTWSSSWLLWGGCLGCVAIHLPAITPSLPIHEPAWKFHCARKQVKASQGTAVCHTVSFRHIPSILSMPLCQLVAEALCHVGLPHSRSSFFFSCLSSLLSCHHAQPEFPPILNHWTRLWDFNTISELAVTSQFTEVTPHVA